jgi:hypothetical protein
VTPIEVPQLNDRVWEQSGSVKLTEEAERWLETFVGIQQFRHPDSEPYSGDKDHYIIANNWHSVNRDRGTRIFFSNPAHAAMFKLSFL